VYAPPAGIGNFGGEIDNWRWPRHAGDFAFFRAYTDDAGKAADYQATNVPYRPDHHLEIATRPLSAGDLAIVLGYPGRTSAHEVARVVKETIEVVYPRRLAMFDAYVAAIEDAVKDDPEAKIKAIGWVRRFNNYETKHQGELFGFEQGKVLERKLREERQLRSVADEGRRARFSRTLDAIDAALDERDRTREADTALSSEILLPRLVWAANLIVRMAEERKKPDADRDPDYQDRRIPDLRAELAAMEKRYHPKVDQAMLTLALYRVLATPAADRTAALAVIAGDAASSESIRRAVSKLYQGTKLADEKTRLRLSGQEGLESSQSPRAKQRNIFRSGEMSWRSSICLRQSKSPFSDCPATGQN
jgi:hypothetical protein